MCLHASFPKKYTSRAIELLSDIAINPVFPSDELHKEKEIILDEINSYLDSPYEKIFDDFEEEMFKGHALGNNILGKKEGLNEFTKTDLQEYVKSYFTKDNLVVSYVGEVPLKKVVQYLDKYLINMPASSSSNSFEVFNNYKSFDIYRKRQIIKPMRSLEEWHLVIKMKIE